MKRLSFLFAALFCLFSAFSPREAEPLAEGLPLQGDNTVLSSWEDTGNHEGLQGTSPSIGHASQLYNQHHVQRGGRRVVRTLHGKLLTTTLSENAKSHFRCVYFLRTIPQLNAQRPKDYYVFALRRILI